MSLPLLYAKPGYLIRRAQQIAVAIFLEETADLDLTPVQYAALYAIREHPGIDATRLAGLIAFDRPTVGGVLERLEGKGWILRSGSPSDKRIKLLALTPEGAALLEQAEPGVQRAQERILGPLKRADQDKLVALLIDLVTLNNEASRAPRRGFET
ncbi:MarR family winged helix-turn-helix transcriptional regulator [Phreatobacter stygius]|uniref:MarR family transcriptional regulator n=1 Tax=Phreatobacter stygius TaxID=1940610 RepID=A0A4D7B9E5_9HYPH|nr:MarR family transcriptional regulator [Phreatobacter stygius]QCI64737.1 MarR family transcriptional regulator [Phreatobacter stygius]